MKVLAIRLAVVGIAGMTALAAAVPSLAQSNQQVLDRLTRLESNLQALQSEVYAGGSAAGSANLAPTAAANIEVRLQQIENEMRTLTGRVEELTFRMDRLEGRFDRNQADLEMRLQQGGGVGAPVVTPPLADATPSGAPAPAPAVSPPLGSSTIVIQGNSGPLVPSGGSAPLASAPAESPAIGTQSAAVSSSATVLPQGAPAEDYNNAYALLLQADYTGAEGAFRAFLANHPNDPLAGNAQYWLGETYYVRENFQQAAVHFAEGYQRYPGGPKASANLLKLGMSLGRLGKTIEACASFDELAMKFPNAPSNVQQYARTEGQRLGCN